MASYAFIPTYCWKIRILVYYNRLSDWLKLITPPLLSKSFIITNGCSLRLAEITIKSGKITLLTTICIWKKREEKAIQKIKLSVLWLSLQTPWCNHGIKIHGETRDVEGVIYLFNQLSSISTQKNWGMHFRKTEFHEFQGLIFLPHLNDSSPKLAIISTIFTVKGIKCSEIK